MLRFDVEKRERERERGKREIYQSTLQKQTPRTGSNNEAKLGTIDSLSSEAMTMDLLPRQNFRTDERHEIDAAASISE